MLISYKKLQDNVHEVMRPEPVTGPPFSFRTKIPNPTHGMGFVVL